MTKLRWLKFAFVFTALSILWCCCCWAARDEVPGIVDRDCAAFVVIDEPANFVELVEGLLFDSDSRIARAIEILQDQNVDLLGSNEFQAVAEAWVDMKDFISTIERISIIVYPDPGRRVADPDDEEYNEPVESEFKFSVLLEFGNQDTAKLVETLKTELVDAQAFFAGMQPSVEQQPSSDPDQQSSEFDEYDEAFGDFQYNQVLKMGQSLKKALAGLKLLQSGSYVIVSNDADESSKLLQRLSGSGGRSFRSLAESRSYQKICALLDEQSKNVDIRGFYVPQQFPNYGAFSVTEIFAFPANSLRAGGFSISINLDDEPVSSGENDFRPIIDWDLVVTFAQPATEYGKIIKSYQPIEEMPVFTIPIASLSAIGFDLGSRQEALDETIQLYDPGNGNREQAGGDDTSVAEQDGPEDAEIDSEDNEPAVIPEEDPDKFADYEAYSFLGDSVDFDPSTVTDFADAHFRITTAVPETGEERYLEMYPVKDYDQMRQFFMLWVEKQNQELETEEFFVESECAHGTLFAQSLKTVRKQFKQLNGDGNFQSLQSADLDSQQLPERIMGLQTELFLNDRWMICTDHVTMKTLMKELFEQPPASSDFIQFLESWKARHEELKPIRVIYESYDHRYKLAQSHQLHHLRNKFLESNQESKLEEIVQAGPDEFGIYNQLDSKDEIIVAIQQLLFDFQEELFGTYLETAHAGDDNFRKLGQFYIKVKNN